MQAIFIYLMMLTAGILATLNPANCLQLDENSKFSAHRLQERRRNRMLTYQQVVQFCGTEGIPSNIFSDSNREEENRIFDLIANSVPQSSTTLIDLMLEANPNYSSWLQRYARYAAVWLVFLLVSFILLILFTFARICNTHKTCHRARWGKCRICFPSRSRKCLTLDLVLLLLLTLGAIGCSISGFLYILRVGNGYDHTTCSAVYLMNMINAGNNTYGWGGLSYMADKFEKTFPLISSAQNYTDISFGDNTSLINFNNSFVQQLNTTYNSWNGTTVISASPWQVSYVTPDIFQAWGPPNKTQTVTGVIYDEMVTRANEVAAANSLVAQAAWNLGNYSDIILYNASLTISNVLNVSRSVQHAQDKLVSVFGFISPNVFKISALVIFGLVTGHCVFSFIVVVIELHHIRIHAPINAVWSIMLMLSMVCFALGFVYFFVTGVGVEVCGLSKYILTNEQAFDNFSLAQEFPWVQNFKECLYSSTPTTIDSQFNVSESIPDIITLINGVKNLSEYFSANYPQSTSVNSLIAYLTDVQRGLKYDYTTAQDDTAPGIAIGNFNKWASYLISQSLQSSTGACKVSLDEWQYNRTNCTYRSNGTITDPLITQLCFSISDSDYLDVENRYTGYFGSCQLGTNNETIDTILESYFNSTRQHYDDVTTKYQSLNQTFGSFLQSAVDPINQEVDNLVSPVANISVQLASLIDAFNNPKTGILSGLNCNFIPKLMNQLQDNFCLGFVVPSFSMSLVFVMGGFFFQLGGVMAFLVMRKLRTVELEEKEQAKHAHEHKLSDLKISGVSSAIDAHSATRLTVAASGSGPMLESKIAKIDLGQKQDTEAGLGDKNNALPDSLFDIRTIPDEGEPEKVKIEIELEPTKRHSEKH